jgi:hypothetical protein
MRLFIIIALCSLALATGWGLYTYGRSLWYPIYTSAVGPRTVQEVLVAYGEAAESRLIPRFRAAGVEYPPRRLTLIGLKAEKRLELWGGEGSSARLVHSYPLLAASGVAGPKLREGDRQVPEGRYRIVGLNPNSSYHLSMKLDYPNRFDLRHAEEEGRADPGSDIFIHGQAVSIGCLAIGDTAIEELFVLSAKVGKDRVRVLILPHDARQRSLFPIPSHVPKWTGELYEMLERELAAYSEVPVDAALGE